MLKAKYNIVLEGGAREGAVTRDLLEKGSTVYAYEPNPISYKKLCVYVADFKKAHCINKALWNASGNASLYTWGSSYGSSLYAQKDLKGRLPLQTTNIQTIDIADVINEIGCIDLMHLDIEGAEYVVLKRIHECDLWNKIGLIDCEMHGHKSPYLSHLESQCIDYIGEGNWNRIRRFQ